MQLGSQTASLLEHSIYKEGLGAGEREAPEQIRLDRTGGVVSLARLSVPWVWKRGKKTNRD